MKTLLRIVHFALLIGIAALLISIYNRLAYIAEYTERIAYPSETIEVYTPKDIYYLEGGNLFTESGSMDITTTRTRALQILSERTADDTQPTN